jgi:hypothetical protein
MAAIRLLTSFQNTPCPIPHDLVDKGVKLFPKAVAANDDLLSEWDVDFYEPEWWHPEYIKAYRNMVEAYGKALDGNPRLAWIDMRFYGYWGEGHRFHATVPWPDDIDKREWCKSRLDEFRAAFKKTPLVMETACDENTPYPEGTAIDYAVDHGLWMRRDGFGNYVSPEESAYLKANWKRSLIVAENAQSLDNFLNGKVRKWWDENAKPTTIDQLFDEIFDHHVNYFPLGWSQQAYELVERERPDLWKKASLKTGYRMIVAEASWPKTASASGAVDFTTTWRNTAVGRLPFPYVPTLYLLDADGKAVAKAAQPAADATKWYENEGHAVEFKLTLAEGIAPGEYKVAVGIEDENAKPAIRLGIDGDDGQRRHVLGTISLE